MSDQSENCYRLKFDEVAEIPCACGTDNEETTSHLPTSTDDRCADPAFAALHPDICGGYPRLILKPAALCLAAFNSFQLKTYLYANGTEVELTNGLEYKSSDPTVASVGPISGKVMGVATGICFVTVTWQNLSAFCQISVSTQVVSVGMAVVIDDSWSMSQAFGSPYPTKLDFAKAAGRLIADELNTEKDTMAVLSVAEAGALRLGLTNDPVELKKEINKIPSSKLYTDLNEGLVAAIDLFATSTVDRQVIVLITDGENKLGDDPLVKATEFKDQGGVIIVLGVRAHGLGYDLLMKIASGGFFLSAYSSSYEDALAYLSGLKGYLCAGNCAQVGDVILPQPELDYDGFLNWDVTGKVDLVGDWLWDVLPGNGFYVDMCGTAPPYKGKLTSKTAFNLSAGQEYKVSLYVAGNQRFNDGTYTLNVKLGTVIDEDIVISNWKQDFTLYEFSVTPAAGESAVLTIEQTGVPVPQKSPQVGLLIDRVKVENVTTPATLLEDDFDDENPTYIPPKCGMSTLSPYVGLYYGTACYGYGCLTAPPTEQSPDPNPPIDIEA